MLRTDKSCAILTRPLFRNKLEYDAFWSRVFPLYVYIEAAHDAMTALDLQLMKFSLPR